jgi:hypothetical protein
MRASKLCVNKKPQEQRQPRPKLGCCITKSGGGHHQALKHAGEGHLLSDTIQYQTELSSVIHYCLVTLIMQKSFAYLLHR